MSFNLCRVFMESFTSDVSWEVLLNSSSKSRGAGVLSSPLPLRSSHTAQTLPGPKHLSHPAQQETTTLTISEWFCLEPWCSSCSACSKAFYSSSANYERISAVIYLQHLNEIRASTVTTTWWCLGLIGSALALSFSQKLQNFFFWKGERRKIQEMCEKMVHA